MWAYFGFHYVLLCIGIDEHLSSSQLLKAVHMQYICWYYQVYFNVFMFSLEKCFIFNLQSVYVVKMHSLYVSFLKSLIIFKSIWGLQRPKLWIIATIG